MSSFVIVVEFRLLAWHFKRIFDRSIRRAVKLDGKSNIKIAGAKLFFATEIVFHFFYSWRHIIHKT